MLVAQLSAETMAGLTFGQTVQEGSLSAPESAWREANSDGVVPSQFIWAYALPVRSRGLHKLEVVISRYMGRKRAGTACAGAADLQVPQHRCSVL